MLATWCTATNYMQNPKRIAGIIYTFIFRYILRLVLKTSKRAVIERTSLIGHLFCGAVPSLSHWQCHDNCLWPTAREYLRAYWLPYNLLHFCWVYWFIFKWKAVSCTSLVVKVWMKLYDLETPASVHTFKYGYTTELLYLVRQVVQNISYTRLRNMKWTGIWNAWFDITKPRWN